MENGEINTILKHINVRYHFISNDKKILNLQIIVLYKNHI